MNLSIRHKDTCTPDYLNDHHNREGEFLVGILLGDYESEAKVAESLLETINRNAPEEFPFDFEDPKLVAAVTQAATGVDCRVTDDCGNHVSRPAEDEEGSEEALEKFEKLLESCECYAWFLVEWEAEDA